MYNYATITNLKVCPKTWKLNLKQNLFFKEVTNITVTPLTEVEILKCGINPSVEPHKFEVTLKDSVNTYIISNKEKIELEQRYEKFNKFHSKFPEQSFSFFLNETEVNFSDIVRIESALKNSFSSNNGVLSGSNVVHFTVFLTNGESIVTTITPEENSKIENEILHFSSRIQEFI